MIITSENDLIEKRIIPWNSESLQACANLIWKGQKPHHLGKATYIPATKTHFTIELGKTPWKPTDFYLISCWIIFWWKSETYPKIGLTIEKNQLYRMSNRCWANFSTSYFWLEPIFLSPDWNPTTHMTWQTSTASNISPKMKDRTFLKRFAKMRWFQCSKSVLGNLDPYSGTWT